jgi:hypothetical protein
MRLPDLLTIMIFCQVNKHNVAEKVGKSELPYAVINAQLGVEIPGVVSPDSVNTDKETLWLRINSGACSVIEMNIRCL